MTDSSCYLQVPEARAEYFGNHLFFGLFRGHEWPLFHIKTRNISVAAKGDSDKVISYFIRIDLSTWPLIFGTWKNKETQL